MANGSKFIVCGTLCGFSEPPCTVQTIKVFTWCNMFYTEINKHIHSVSNDTQKIDTEPY